MCVCCFGCVPSHTSQRRRSFGRPEDASSARRSFCIAQAPPADTRRVEPQQGLDALFGSLLHSFVERHFRSSARWSRSDFSWSPDTMPWTPSGASPSVDHWGRPRARRRPWTTGRSRCPSRASSHRVEVAQRRRRELRARERARDALGALVRLPRHEARVLEAVHARRAPRAAQTYVPRSPVLQIVGDARLKRSDDAVSWRCASQDIMRVLRPAFRGARAAHAGSTAWERSWRTHISIETGPNRPSRRRRPPKTKKKPRASSVGVGHVRRDKKKRGTTGIEPVTSRTRSANRALSRHVGDPGIPLDHAPISNPRPDSRCCDSTELLCCDFLGRFGL